jgi:hypothetical protein
MAGSLLRLGAFVLGLLGLRGVELVAPDHLPTAPMRARWLVNLGFGAVNGIIVSLACASCYALSAQSELAAHLGPLRGLGLGVWTRIPLEIVLLDLVTYLLHRAYHAAPLLWRLHVVHHSDMDLDVSSASRFHTGEVLVSSILKIGVVIVAGISPQGLVIFGTGFSEPFDDTRRARRCRSAWSHSVTLKRSASRGCSCSRSRYRGIPTGIVPGRSLKTERVRNAHAQHEGVADVGEPMIPLQDMERWNNIRVDGTVEVDVRTQVVDDHREEVATRTVRESDSSARSYEHVVLQLLHRIRGNRAGRVVLDAIARFVPGRGIRIVPVDLGYRNAAALSFPDARQAPRGNLLTGEPLRALTAADHAARSGAGSDVLLLFNPLDRSHRTVAGGAADCALFHELVHAYRDMRGHRRADDTHDHFRNLEEFIAVTLGNVYMSAAGERLLRTDHNGGLTDDLRAAAGARGLSDSLARKALNLQSVLSPFQGGFVDNPFTEGTPDSDSARFARRYGDYLDRLMAEETLLCVDLARIVCSFNPIRDRAMYRS